MPVFINFKICDNCDACNAINVCPTKAFHWDDNKKTLCIDDTKCINCGLCATSSDTCRVGAIKFGITEEDCKNIIDEINNDPRTIADLMVDRYGSQPINLPFYCTEDELKKIITTDKICLIELFNDESIECLIKSIPIKKIMNDIDNENNLLYRKLEVKTQSFLNNYNVNKLPAMIIFSNGKYLGKIEGYYDQESKNNFIKKIKDIINSSL